MNSKKHLTNAPKRRRSRALHWACENLEDRYLLAAVSWVTQGSGDWSVGSNWSNGNVPAPGDDVTINVPGLNIVVTYSAGAPLQLNNLVNAEILDIEGGGATWTSGTWDGSGIVEVGTSLSISGSADKILKDGQSIENVGTTTLSGSGNIVGQVGASIVNEPMATFNATSNAGITFPTGVGDGIFENGGTFVKTGTGTTTLIGGPQGFRFEDSIDDVLHPEDSTPGDCQIVSGTLSLGDDQNLATTEGGTFEISSGATLDYSRGQANIVVLRPPGAPADVIPHITGPDGATNAGAGTLEVSGTANIQMYGILAVTEVDVLNSATLLLQQNMQEPAGTTQLTTNIPNKTPAGTPAGITNVLTLSDTATFGGNGGGIYSVSDPVIQQDERPCLEVTDRFTWTGGTLAGQGRLQIDSSATSTISTTNAKAINGGFGLDIFDEDVWTGSGTITENGGSVFFIHSTGTLWDEGNGTITQGLVDNLGGNVWNMGNLLKDDSTGVTTLGPGIAFRNDINPLNYRNAQFPILEPTGTVGPPDTGEPFYDIGSPLLAKLSIVTGTVSLQGTSINNDNILISPGATLSYDAGTHFNQAYVDSNDVINASILGHNNGTLNLGNCIFNSDSGALVDVAHVVFGTGEYTFDNTAPGAQTIQSGVFNGGSTGVIGGAGTLEVGPPNTNGSFLWNGGTFVTTTPSAQSAPATPGTLLIDPGATLTIPSGDRSTLNNYYINNDGTILWTTSPGTLNVNGNYTQTSTGAFDSVVTGAPNLLNHLNVTGTTTLAGGLNLSLSNFVPSDGEIYVLVSNIGTSPISGTFNGLAQGATITVGAAQFIISYTGGDGNDVTLTATVFPTLTIADPDPVTEGDTGQKNLIFTVTMSAAVAHDVSVNYATSSGTATSGVDFVATTGTLTIPAGQITGTIAVPIIGDTIVEPTETFTVTLSNPVNAQLGAKSTATGTILNDDGPPLILLSQSNYTVDVGTGLVTITVVRTNIQIPVTVDYTTQDDTAIAGTDYTAVRGTLSFASGVAVRTFTVPLLATAVTGSGKIFNVVLSNPQGGGATIGIAVAHVNIVNDPNLPQISVADATVTEPLAGQLNEVFTVTVNKPVATGFTIEYRTVGGSATSDGDFVAESGTLVFAPNQLTAQINVPVNSDFEQEGTETYNVILSDPSSDESIQNATATGTILNQNVNSVTFDQLHPYRYTDARGQISTIMIHGPGTGSVLYLGLPSNDAKEVILDGTTSQSQLVFRSASQSYIVNITVNGSMRAITGPTLNLQGDITVSGALQRLQMNSLLGGNSISIGAGTGDIKNLTAILGHVTDSTFTSALPLAQFKVASWNDSASGVDITAPSALNITSTGIFQADVSLTGSLGTLNVGQMDSSTINVAGNITAITAASMSNSMIFAGVTDGVSTLPTSAQFDNRVSTITRLNIRAGKAGTFSNTLVAAPSIGQVQLGTVTTANNGTPFGIVGTSIKSVKGKDGAVLNLTANTLISNPFTKGDLQIHLAQNSI